LTLYLLLNNNILFLYNIIINISILIIKYKKLNDSFIKYNLYFYSSINILFNITINNKISYILIVIIFINKPVILLKGDLMILKRINI